MSESRALEGTGAHGTRLVPAAEFFQDYFTTALQDEPPSDLAGTPDCRRPSPVCSPARAVLGAGTEKP